MIGKIKNSISKKQQQEPEEESENEAANTTGSTWSLMASASAMSANSVPPNPGPTMAYDGSARPKIPPPEAESEEPTASTATGTSTGTSNATKKSTKEKAPATHLEADDLSTSLAKVKLKKQPIDKKTLDTVKKDENDAKREGKEPKKTRQLKMLERKQKFRPPLTDKEKAARQIWNDENHAAKLEARDYYNKVRVDALMDEITWEDGEYIMEEVTTLPEWPPALTKTQLDKLKERAITYAISTGFVIIPPAAENRSIVTHAPLSLLPTPFPRTLFQTAKTLQTILNSLYMRIAVDHAFLSKVFEGSVNHVDPWQNWLYYYYRHCRKFPNALRTLGIFRSDYLLHQPTPGEPLQLKQVEFNTIAASFGGLSSKAVNLHRHLAVASRGYYNTHPLLRNSGNYADPDSAESIASSLADAHYQYCEEVGRKQPVVLFVVQEGERNIYDQKAIEDILLHKYRIRTERRTFKELKTQHCGMSRPHNVFFIKGPEGGVKPDIEVAVVYFRAGYTPEEYDEDKSQFRIRVLMERSKAIVCPTFALQLAGAKKVQQVLTEPGVLESFLLDKGRPDTGFGMGAGWLTDEWCKIIRSTWVNMWPLDDTEMGQEGLALAMAHPENFVMKPQREGGGNNIYRTDIPPALDKMSGQVLKNGRCPWEQYVLMELIQPPQGVYNYLIKGGEDYRKVEVVSELGVYGTINYGIPGKLRNKRGGILLRTKAKTSDEGGVAIGISSIDSPLLIDEDYVPEPPAPKVDFDDPNTNYYADGYTYDSESDKEDFGRIDPENEVNAKDWEMEYIEDDKADW